MIIMIRKYVNSLASGGKLHYENFIDAMRSRNAEDLNGPILEGHISNSLSHMANISLRLGQSSAPEVIQEAIKSQQSAAVESVERFQDNLFANWIDLTKDQASLGPWLEIDSKNEKFVGTGDYGVSRWANEMLKEQYREPFVVPEKV